MKFLVISLAGIGDTLFATPLIHELRANFPDAMIDALVLWRGARDVLGGNPHLNCIHQRNLLADSKLAAARFLIGLRQKRYDVSLNTHPQSRLEYRFVALMINARMRISHSYHSPGWLDRLCVNRLLAQDYASHAVTNNLSFLKLLGVKPKLSRHAYELYLTREETEWAEAYLTANSLSGKPILAIHVGSGGTKNLAQRRWPLAKYKWLIQRVTCFQPEARILLVGGPEEERDHAWLQRETDRSRVLFPPTGNLRQAAALIQRCRCFLSVDTALMHVAAAMRVPAQIVIETPTWNKVIQPQGNAYKLVRNPAVNGRNLEFYRYDGHGIRGSKAEIREWMNSVSVEAVLDAVLQGLS